MEYTIAQLCYLSNGLKFEYCFHQVLYNNVASQYIYNSHAVIQLYMLGQSQLNCMQLGDHCIRNFHLGRYIVGYMVGNLVFR